MGLVKGLVKVGAVVGAVKVGEKVAEQYRANNPEGVQDVNGDGVIDLKDKTIEVTRAAAQVFDGFADKVQEKLSK